MTTLEAIVYALGGGGAVKAIDFVFALLRRRGDQTAKREAKTDDQLWAWIARERAERLAAEEKCDERISAVEARADAAEKRSEECERRSAAQAVEIDELRRTIRSGEATARHGVPKGDNR